MDIGDAGSLWGTSKVSDSGDGNALVPKRIESKFEFSAIFNTSLCNCIFLTIMVGQSYGPAACTSNSSLVVERMWK